MNKPGVFSPDPAALFTREAFYRAWQQVRRNGHSPGVDRVSTVQFSANLNHELGRLRAELIDGRYKPHPVQRYYKRKPSGKVRALSIWTIRDCVAQRVVLDYITPTLEALYLDCSYGFRPGRRSEQAWTAIMAGYRDKLRWVVDADIADCFDSIPIAPLMARVQAVIDAPRAVALIDGWLHNPVVGQPGTMAGVSQGAVISPQLTNLYLHQLDATIHRLPTVRLIRFADDFVILCPTQPIAQIALHTARWQLHQLGLRLNDSKTRLVHFDQGFTFLGAQFGNGAYRVLYDESIEEN